MAQQFWFMQIILNRASGDVFSLQWYGAERNQLKLFMNYQKIKTKWGQVTQFFTWLGFEICCKMLEIILFFLLSDVQPTESLSTLYPFETCYHWLFWVLLHIWSLCMQLLPLPSLYVSLCVNDHFSTLLFLCLLLSVSKLETKNTTK